MEQARAVPRRVRGFSLAEMLLAATLGSLLVTAAASSAGSFSQTVAQLRSDVVDDYEAVTARIARDVRYAWWVEVPSRDQIRIADATGQVTEYYRVGNSLLVRRPSGEEGSVITGLAGVRFEQTTMRRLREDRQEAVSGRIGGVAAPPTATSTLQLQPGDAVALAFTVPATAGPVAVSDVNETYLARTPNRIDLLATVVGLGGYLHGEIYPARAPGDGRPRPGATSLGTFDVSLLGLPLASVLTSVGHGAATYSAPSAKIPIALTGAQALRPGVAYTLQVSIRGSGTALLTKYASLSGANDAVAWRDNPTDAWSTLSSVFSFDISGVSNTTATKAQDVASQIRISLMPAGESAHVASAAVFSQVLADDPWLGVLPGEAPPAP